MFPLGSMTEVDQPGLRAMLRHCDAHELNQRARPRLEREVLHPTIRHAPELDLPLACDVHRSGQHRHMGVSSLPLRLFQKFDDKALPLITRRALWNSAFHFLDV